MDSRVFPENKPTNDLKQILIDLEKEYNPSAYDFNRSSQYLNSRLPEIAQLLQQKADPNIIYRGKNLASYAIQYKNIQLINLLKNAPIPGQFDAKYPTGIPFWFQISFDRLQVLLQANAVDINQKSNDGDTALLYAIDHPFSDNYKWAIRLLLQYHADPTILNNRGENAAEAARRKELPEDIIQLLQNAIDYPQKQKLP